MATANDNNEKPRRFRNEFLNGWSGSDFTRLSSDEALLRLAQARNAASLSSNRFMLIAAALALLYFLRVQNLAGDLKIGSYSLASLPFGHFVLGATSLITSSVSFVRNGDSRSYDRYLQFVCDKRFDCDSNLMYISYPNEHAWGEPFSNLVFMPSAGKFLTVFRGISMLALNLFLLGLVILPCMAGLDFLWNMRAFSDTQFIQERSIFIGSLLAINILTMLIVFWARFADRD